MRGRQTQQYALPIPEMAEPEVRLADWDVILLNTSGGKDSQTMMNEVCRRVDTEGIERSRLVAVHANLGRVEWPGTLELAQAQAEAHGLEFGEMAREQGDLLDHVEARGKWPGPRACYCTSDHKRSQISKVVTALDRERRVGTSFRLLNVLGLRADESPARAKKRPFIPNGNYSTKTRTVWDWLPIHSWSDEDVWADIAESGVPYHRAYDLGMPRLSCAFCIYAPKAALVLAGQHNPELLAEYAAVERRIGHTFKADLSIEEVRAAVEADEVQETATSWRM